MLFTVVAVSAVVKAQTGDSLNGQLYQQSLSYNVNIGYQLNRQNENDLQLKIAALGNRADAEIFMPVLFGVGVKDISLNFGDMRFTGSSHAGEDIMAIRGTPIVSPTNAVVIRVTTDLNSSEGNAVYTANPGGEIFIYYHLSGVGEGVVPGLVLAQGSLIGYVGDTGSAKGTSHLHLEIRNSEGLATNPFTRLTVEFTPEQKILFLKTILTQTSDPVSLSQFLITNFRSTFVADIQNGITLPLFITDALAGNQASGVDMSKQQLIGQIKQQIISLMQQAIQLLQAQISEKISSGQ
jgi:murein DD-endopeptidase MepM/ murein hydrolase activator NlpD